MTLRTITRALTEALENQPREPNGRFAKRLYSTDRKAMPKAVSDILHHEGLDLIKQGFMEPTAWIDTEDDEGNPVSIAAVSTWARGKKRGPVPKHKYSVRSK